MEVRIWMEDVPRVVCGVVEQTTCRDIVVALAQTVGRTGRYILVERWRGNERRLGPSESLLRALLKRGEYASEVEFILRHSRRSRRDHENTVQDRKSNGTDSGVTSSESGVVINGLTEKRGDNSTNLLKYRTFGGIEHLHLIGQGLANGDVSNGRRNGTGISNSSHGNGSSPGGHVVSRDYANGNSLESSEQSSVASRSSVSISPQASIDLSTSGSTLSGDLRHSSIPINCTNVGANSINNSVNHKHGLVNSSSSNSNVKSGERAIKLPITGESFEPSKSYSDEPNRGLYISTNSEKYELNSTPVEVDVQHNNSGSRKSSSSSTNFSPMSSISSEVSSENSRHLDNSRSAHLSSTGKPGYLVTNAMETAAHSTSTAVYPQSFKSFSATSDHRYLATPSSDHVTTSALGQRNGVASSRSGSSNIDHPNSIVNRAVLNSAVTKDGEKLVSTIISDEKTSAKSLKENERHFVNNSTQSNDHEVHESGRYISKDTELGSDNATNCKVSRNELVRSSDKQGNNNQARNLDSNINSHCNFTETVDNQVKHCGSSKSCTQYNQSSDAFDKSSETNSPSGSHGSSVKELRNLFTTAAASNSTTAPNLGLDRRELFETVRQQNDVIMRQLRQLEELESEISSSQLTHEDEDESAHGIELRALIERESAIDGELMELELVSWEDKLDIEQRKETQMTSELSLLKSNILRSEKEIERLEDTRNELENELKVLASADAAEATGLEESDPNDLQIRLNEMRLKNVSTVKQLRDVTAEVESAKLETEERRSRIAKLNTEILQADQLLLKLLHSADSENNSDKRVNV